MLPTSTPSLLITSRPHYKLFFFSLTNSRFTFLKQIIYFCIPLGIDFKIRTIELDGKKIKLQVSSKSLKFKLFKLTYFLIDLGYSRTREVISIKHIIIDRFVTHQSSFSFTSSRFRTITTAYYREYT